MLTVLEGGQRVVRLLVRLCLLEGNTNGNDVLYYSSAKKNKNGLHFMSCHDVEKGMRCTENAALSRGYQLTASCKLFNLRVSMMPPTVLNVPALRLPMNKPWLASTSAGVTVAFPTTVPTRQSIEIILPDDSLQAQLIFDIATAVLCHWQQLISRYSKAGEVWSAHQIAIRRTPTGRCDAGDELDVMKPRI